MLPYDTELSGKDTGPTSRYLEVPHETVKLPCLPKTGHFDIAAVKKITGIITIYCRVVSRAYLEIYYT